MKTRTFLQAMGLGLTLPASQLFAQGASGRPIRMVVPLPAGTSNDTSTRAISPPLSQLLGQPIFVDNKAGANGVIGTMEVVRAQPDGLTLMCGSLSPLATNVAFVKNLPYDPRRDLTPIGLMEKPWHGRLVRDGVPDALVRSKMKRRSRTNQKCAFGVWRCRTGRPGHDHGRGVRATTARKKLPASQKTSTQTGSHAAIPIRTQPPRIAPRLCRVRGHVPLYALELKK